MVPFKTAVFADSFKINTKKSITDILTVDVNKYDTLGTPLKKAEFLCRLMDDLISKCPVSKVKSIMQMCGHSCIPNSIIQKAKKIFKESNNIEILITKLNENHIGGGHLKLNGKTIYGTYTKCYCGSVSKTKKKMSIEYCYCSAGWYQKLFEEILQTKVNVEIIETIISGSEKCVFRICI